jgi:hypothetical protein
MSFKTFIKSHLDGLQSQIFTTLPAAVIDNSEYESKCIVTVRPLIDMLHSDGQVSECPIIYNVPVVNPSAGGGMLSFPIQNGDTVLLQFSMRNIEEWLEGSGDAVIEPTMRYHDISDGMAIIGLYTKNNHLQPSPDDVVLKFKGNSITLKNDGNVEVITKAKLSISNDQEELVNLLSELIQEISISTCNTVYGISPLNNKPALQAIKSRIDSFKK